MVAVGPWRGHAMRSYHPSTMKSERSGPDELDEVQRPWDNAGLRHRVEGRAIEGIDVLALQSRVLTRGAEARRRWRLRPRSSERGEVKASGDTDLDEHV